MGKSQGVGLQGVVLVLMGPPGGGKGTQAKKLVEEFGLEHFSVGDALREEVRRGSSLGQQVAKIMESGELVPDVLIEEIIRSRLNGEGGENGFILDGYPRNVSQAEFLASVTEHFRVYAVAIEVEEGQILKRLSGRRSCPKCGSIYNIYFSPPTKPGICDRCGSEVLRRKDDQEEVIAERLRVYREQTQPVADFYRSVDNYHEIDGNWEPNEVYSKLRGLVRTFQA
jgi:adenylate kinase